MKTKYSPFGKYLWIALGLAFLSIILSIGILFIGASQYGPIDPPVENPMEHIANVATLSSSVSGIFALIVGAIAIIAVIATESAENKAADRVKLDIANLWMALLSIRNRGFLYSQIETSDAVDLFKDEATILSEILNSPTGFALYIWESEYSSEGSLDLTFKLIVLINYLIQNTIKRPDLFFREVSFRSNKIAELMSKITDKDVRKMSSIIQGIGAGLDQAREILDNDDIAKFIEDYDKSMKKILIPPTQEEVDTMATKALGLIGGKADETIKLFGEKAINGTEEDVANWHKLISQLSSDMEKTSRLNLEPEGLVL